MTTEEPLDSQTSAKEICKEHYWAWHNDPHSIPTQYNKCMVCDVIDCSEAIQKENQKARIEELKMLRQQFSYPSQKFLRSALNHRISELESLNNE